MSPPLSTPVTTTASRRCGPPAAPTLSPAATSSPAPTPTTSPTTSRQRSRPRPISSAPSATTAPSPAATSTTTTSPLATSATSSRASGPTEDFRRPFSAFCFSLHPRKENNHFCRGGRYIGPVCLSRCALRLHDLTDLFRMRMSPQEDSAHHSFLFFPSLLYHRKEIPPSHSWAKSAATRVGLAGKANQVLSFFSSLGHIESSSWKPTFFGYLNGGDGVWRDLGAIGAI
ncbi:DNase1 protein [Colletotrichum higginsianum]|uniref:DNase1 protein n=1 Tax=Colletotrichum higginsianum (strain IMI 349063) TaxID=759273 RepID=H1W4Y3_COLHI|nr:DNase1 protein [Colletotrichum higginsianum]